MCFDSESQDNSPGNRHCVERSSRTHQRSHITLRCAIPAGFPGYHWRRPQNSRLVEFPFFYTLTTLNGCQYPLILRGKRVVLDMVRGSPCKSNGSSQLFEMGNDRNISWSQSVRSAGKTFYGMKRIIAFCSSEHRSAYTSQFTVLQCHKDVQ